MTYSEANTILGSSLTPNNRCICKKTARDNHADPAPLASFTDNRLVPVDYVNLVEYDITFKYDNNTTWKTERYAYGATPTPGTPSLSGQIFDGWSPAITAVTGPATYVATWHAETVYYTVTYTWTVPGGSSHTETESVASGSTPSNIPSPESVTNYTGSWSPSNPASTTITGNTTFTYNYTYNGPTGPSTTGIVVVQGGFDAALPWAGEPGSGYGLTDDYWPARITLFPQAYNSTPISGRITVTGYKYNFYTKTRTELPSGCYIDFSDLCYSSSNYYSTGVTITLSDALYNQGWRLEETVAGESGQNNHWGDTSLKTKTYHYIGSSICEIGVPGGTPEDMWFVTLSSEDANLSASLVYGVNPPYTTINGTTYSSYYITNSCYASSRDGSRTGRAYTYLDDSELPITSTGTTYADENNYVSVIVSPR